MKRLSLFILVFSLLSAVFFLLLILFRTPFLLYPLMSYQDALDLLTPLVLIPLYWLLFTSSTSGKSDLADEVAFMALAAVWVLGHGMHLSANSINNLADSLAKNQVIDIAGTDVYRLIYFYDERLGHYVWHLGIMGLAALLIYHEWKQPARVITIWWVAAVAALAYGFTYSTIVLEGQTVPLGLPFAVIIALVMLIWGRQKLKDRPLLAFFFATFLVAIVLLASWGLYWGGFPEPTAALGI
jgi:hypothetical protein